MKEKCYNMSYHKGHSYHKYSNCIVIALDDQTCFFQ
uniref:Uncharacterized protein n=1 Tax=Anguilla anguilla TaxID=7936 RepID=A0A0E9UC93_ANGAN